MNKSGNPYSLFSDHHFWKKSVAKIPMHEVDPVVGNSFKIEPSDRVATAGSCFAQHISRHLSQAGFNYFVTEPGHPRIPLELQKTYGYGVFSARFGNIYTTRQLLQLMQRAYGEFLPQDDVWVSKNGTYYDPFRPTINPEGYPTLREFQEDRKQHFAAVRKMFEELDVFVFTLGLTECWVSRQDGAVYPLCPGTSAGTFDPAKHMFLNLQVNDVIVDLELFIEKLAKINPRARIILTVSPVPLVATAENRHVLISTTLSKSILHVAANMVAAKYDHIAYFPSYEIITGTFNKGQYFAEDLRTVTENGVSHVMRVFLKNYTDAKADNPVQHITQATDTTGDLMRKAVQVMCDEEVLERQ